MLRMVVTDKCLLTRIFSVSGSRKQVPNLMFRVSAFIAMRLYFENVDKPHKQMQSDAAKAAPLMRGVIRHEETELVSQI